MPRHPPFPPPPTRTRGGPLPPSPFPSLPLLPPSISPYPPLVPRHLCTPPLPLLPPHRIVPHPYEEAAGGGINNLRDSLSSFSATCPSSQVFHTYLPSLPPHSPCLPGWASPGGPRSPVAFSPLILFTNYNTGRTLSHRDC